MPKARIEGTPKVNPWQPYDWKVPDAAALQALQRGDATPDQQERVLNVILNDLCCIRDMSYRPMSDRDTCFAEGKRFVGLQIAKLLSLNTSAFKEDPSSGRPPP